MKKLNENWKNYNFLIAGTIRDGEKTVERNASNLRQAFNGVKNLNWLIIESDSSDNTINILESLKKRFKNFDYKSLGCLTNTFQRRVPRIAYCRNIYLNEIKKNVKYSKIDYVVVADLDGMNELTNQKAIESCFIRNDWDVCSANQLGPYYDIYALRHSDWCPGDCWKEFAFYRENGQFIEKAYMNAIESKMITIPTNSNWIEVDSAYGGLSIYKKKSMILGQYEGEDELGYDVCDSVVLHRQMRKKNKRIFINPRLINMGVTFHTKNLLFPWNFIKRMKIMIKFFLGILK